MRRFLRACRAVANRVRLVILALVVSTPALAQAPRGAPQSGAAREASLPAVARDAIRVSRESCAPDTFTTRPGFLVERDVNGDGVADVLIDYTHSACGASSSYFCGTAGCSFQLVASVGGRHELVFDDNVHRARFTKLRGRPAMILTVHGSACGRPGADSCAKTLYWNGKTFEADPS